MTDGKIKIGNTHLTMVSGIKRISLLSQTFHYPKNKVFAYQHNLVLEGTIKHFIIWERYYSEKEITDLLEKVGFRKITIYRDLLGKNNFTSSSEIFIVAEK